MFALSYKLAWGVLLTTFTRLVAFHWFDFYLSWWQWGAIFLLTDRIGWWLRWMPADKGSQIGRMFSHDDQDE